VRARMPMKLGKKIVEANTVVMIAKYMVFLLERARSGVAECGAVPGILLLPGIG
jgi:hypothetical protein